MQALNTNLPKMNTKILSKITTFIF
uniref:Uncharacterized protein n=1 Tax=Anguilla anguilla TaxID=7936 RepID=A0A0E9T6B5_ANGAN